jgi:hypothetical protein
MVSVARFEQAIPARVFFDPAWLFVSQGTRDDESTIDGWCLCYPPSVANQTQLNQQASGMIEVAAVCWSNQADSTVGADLLQAVERQAVERLSAGADHHRIVAGVVRDDRYGLAGLNPIGHGIGVPMHDHRLVAALQRHGYHQRVRIIRMIAAVSGYRPPVNRETMQLRRTGQVEFSQDYRQDARSAAAVSHLDIETHRLLDAAEKELAQLQVWFSDPEAEVMNPAQAILDLSSLQNSGQVSVAESYLIGTIIQSLVVRGIAMIETAVDEHAGSLVEQLKGLHFQPQETGIQWQKEF